MLQELLDHTIMVGAVAMMVLALPFALVNLACDLRRVRRAAPLSGERVHTLGAYIIRVAAIVANIGWLIFAVLTAETKGWPDPEETPLVILLFASPVLTLCALHLFRDRAAKESWLRLEIEARKAKLRRQIGDVKAG